MATEALQESDDLPVEESKSDARLVSNKRRRDQFNKMLATRKGKRSSKKYMSAVTDIVFMLLGASLTCSELSADTGVSLTTVREIIRHFRLMDGIIFIDDWKKAEIGSGHQLSPVYTMRRRKGDAPRPKPKTEAEISAAYRERKRKAKALTANAIASMVTELQK